MIRPAVPADEADRLRALREYAILDTPPEAEFDALTRLASTICGTPMSMVSLVDADRQWFKSRVGLDAGQTPRDVSFCGHAILSGDLLVVPDARRDPRFADNPFVTADPSVRFYAGAPLVTPDGHALGTLCVLDRVPRTLTAEQAEALRGLARQAVSQMRLRRAVADVARTLLEHGRAEQVVRTTSRRLQRQLSAIVELTRQGVAAGADLAAAAAAVTAAAARTLDAARASVWMFDEGRTLIRCADLFEAPAGRHTSGTELRRDDYPAYFAALEAEESIAAHDARTDLRTREFADAYLAPLGITSMLDTPVQVRGRVVGVLCVEHVGPPRLWAVDEEAFATSLTNLVAAAVEAGERRRSEERFRKVFDEGPLGIALVGMDLRLIRMNAAFCRMLGYAEADLVGRPVADITHADDITSDTHDAGRLIRGEIHNYRMEKRYLRKDGSVVWGALRASALRDDAGGATCLLGMVEDVTAHREAEAVRARLASVVECSGDAIFRVDVDGRIASWNAGAEAVFGYTAAEAVGMPATALAAPGRAWQVRDVVGRVLGGERIARLEMERARKDGRTVCVSLSASPIRDPASGAVVGVAKVVRDVTEQREAEDRLREQTLVSETLNRIGRTVAAELDLGKVLQVVADEGLRVTRARFGAVYYDETDDRGEAHARYAVAGGEQVTFPAVRPTRAVRHADVTLTELFAGRAGAAGRAGVRSYIAVPVTSRSGKLLGGMYFGHDEANVFTERDERVLEGIAAQAAIAIDNADLFESAKRAGARMAYEATHDVLTGLANRALFNDRVRQCLGRARQDAGYRFAVLFLDLDRFKLVNDSLGHAAGDKLLTAVAARLTEWLARTDHNAAAADAVVARLGGDEFTVLLDGLADAGDAARAAERVLAAVCRPVPFDGHELAMTASIGIVVGGPAYASERDVLRDADAAMYRAKEAGRNRYAVFDDTLHQAAVKRLRLESDLRRAIDRGELVLQYQPIVSLSTRELEGFEALLRWRRDGRIVSPADFIPVAEDTGLIVPIGEWVLREACRQLHAWRAVRPALWMSVNLSRRQLCDPNVLRVVRAALRETGVDPAGVKLEVTESVIMHDADAARAILTEIRRTGVTIAMDDFGTGYSSLSCLHRFPIDVLKVDRSFVADLAGRRHAAAVVHAIVNLAHNLGITVVAEGLEQPEQVAFLQALDCDSGQGFLFARPMPADAAGAFLRAADRLKVPA